MTKKRKVLGFSLVVGLCVGALALTKAEAAPISSSGLICHAKNGSQNGDITAVVNGVRNSNVNSRDVVCAVERQPAAPTSSEQDFFVDGDNLNGKSTSCTISSYEYNGGFLGSKSFTTNSVAYDVQLIMPLTMVTQYAYLSMTCTLPGSNNGTLRGVYTSDI